MSIKVHILSYMSTLLTDRKLFSLRTCQRLSETDLMSYLSVRIIKLFLPHLTPFDAAVARSKYILAFIVQLHNQTLILNQSMCILLGLASPCDCICLWGWAVPELCTEKFGTNRM